MDNLLTSAHVYARCYHAGHCNAYIGYRIGFSTTLHVRLVASNYAFWLASVVKIESTWMVCHAWIHKVGFSLMMKCLEILHVELRSVNKLAHFSMPYSWLSNCIYSGFSGFNFTLYKSSTWRLSGGYLIVFSRCLSKTTFHLVFIIHRSRIYSWCNSFTINWSIYMQQKC
jgi:hypothetical protein